MSLRTNLYDYDKCDTRVKLSKLLGTGAFGSVYEGQYWPNPNDRETFLDVAVKVIKIQPRTDNSQINRVAYSLFDGLVSAFLASKECPVSKTIKNILCSEPPVVGYKKFFVIMEHIKGVELRPYAGQKLSTRVKLSLTEQLLKGFACLHSNKIFHRDIKPENIMIELTDPDSPKVKIIDFGLCCVDGSTEFDKFIKDNVGMDMYGEVAKLLCRNPTGERTGSPLYSPPELSKLGPGKEKVELANTTRSKELRDSFALGCVLYELWQAKNQDMANDFSVIVVERDDLILYYKNTLNGNYPALRIKDGNAPKYIQNIVFRMMEYDYTKRITINQAVKLFEAGDTIGTGPLKGSASSSTASSIAASSSGLGTPIDTQADITIMIIGEKDEQPFKLARNLTNSGPSVGVFDDDSEEDDDGSELYKIEQESCLCIFDVYQKRFEKWKRIIQENAGLTSIIFLIIDSEHDKETIKVFDMIRELHRSRVPIYLLDRSNNVYVEKMAKQAKLEYIPIPKSHENNYRVIQELNDTFNLKLRF